VVVGGHKAEVVDASVKSSDLWEWFTTYSLQQPVRFRDDDGFSSWLDAVGDDRIPYEDVATRSISLQQFRVLKSAEDAIDVMFPPEVLHSPKRCLKMAILSPINEIVDKYNHAILERLEGSTSKFNKSILIDITTNFIQHHYSPTLRLRKIEAILTP